MLEAVDRAYLERIDELAGKIVRWVRKQEFASHAEAEELLRKYGFTLQLVASSTFTLFKQVKSFRIRGGVGCPLVPSASTPRRV